MRDYLVFGDDYVWRLPLPNIWLGVRVENQQAANERIPVLLDIPAAKHFVLCEPLLGPIDLRSWVGERCQLCDGSGMHCLTCGYSGYRVPPIGRREPFQDKNLGIGWVVAGGQYGRDAQRMHPGWARSLRDQCKATSVPFFFRRTGTALAEEWNSQSNDGSALHWIPEDLRVQQNP